MLRVEQVAATDVLMMLDANGKLLDIRTEVMMTAAPQCCVNLDDLRLSQAIAVQMQLITQIGHTQANMHDVLGTRSGWSACVKSEHNG